MGAQTREWLADRDDLPIVALPTDTPGVEPTSSYVETYWLPVLGPSATWALRLMTGRLASAPLSGTWMPVQPLSRALGLGSSVGRNSPIRRTLCRLVDFRLANIDADVFALRTVIPPLTAHQIRRLPDHLIPLHDGDLLRDLQQVGV